MPFTPIDWDTIKVGDPITKDLLDQIKENFDDLESRVNQGETTGGSVFILDEAIHLGNFDPDHPDVFYYKATQDFSISELRVQLYDKGSITSGFLALDLQKSTDTNNSNFNSVLSGAFDFNFASALSYSEKVAPLNTSLTDIEAGQVLRLVVTNIPKGFNDKVLVVIGGE